MFGFHFKSAIVLVFIMSLVAAAAAQSAGALQGSNKRSPSPVEPLPDAAALIKQVSAQQEEVERKQEAYACTAVVTTRKPDRRGGWRDRETKTYDVSFYRGRQIMRLNAKNGQPLSPKDQADEDHRVAKLLREIDQREAAGDQKSGIRKTGAPDPASRTPPISLILQTSELTNGGRETYRRREVIVFDFKPRPGYKPANTAETFLSKSSGRIWVDASARQVVRVEARLDHAIGIGGGLIGAVRSGAKFIIEQGLVKSREGDELWLPTYAEVVIPVRALFIGMTVSSVTSYSDYRQFHVNVEREKLQSPVKP